MERDEMWQWIQRRDAVLRRFRDPAAAPGVPAADPNAEALRIVRARTAAASGSREFPSIEGVVFGVRGAMHGGSLSFGEEFAFGGHLWVIASHLEYGKRKQTLVVNAVRKDALQALFSEGVYVTPQARRETEEKARERAALDLVLTYGLTAAAYGAARDLVARRVEAGRVAPEDAEAEVPGFLRYTADLVRCADQWRFSDPLRPDNVTSRGIFERLTGTTLPRTLKATEEMLRSEPPAAFERGRLSAEPPCREAVASICVAFSRHLSKVATDGEGFRHLRDAYVRRGLSGGLELADAALVSFAERVGADEDLDLAHQAVRAMREAMAGVEAEGFAPDACDLAHGIICAEADRLREAVAGHAPAAPGVGR